MPATVTTIHLLVFIVSITLGLYNLYYQTREFIIVFGVVSLFRIPRDVYFKTKDSQYLLFTLVVILSTVPFIIITDVVGISFGYLEDYYTLFPYHCLIMNFGFVIISMNFSHWAHYEQIKEIMRDKNHPMVIEQFSPEKKNNHLNNIKKLDLSPREKDVTQLLLQFSSYKKIAAELHISPTTVKSHILNIYQKASVSSRGDLLSKLDYSEEKYG